MNSTMNLVHQLSNLSMQCAIITENGSESSQILAVLLGGLIVAVLLVCFAVALNKIHR